MEVLLTNLTYLALGDCQISGGIPYELGNLTELYYINFKNHKAAIYIETKWLQKHNKLFMILVQFMR